jgi:hypothetical protein
MLHNYYYSIYIIILLITFQINIIMNNILIITIILLKMFTYMCLRVLHFVVWVNYFHVMSDIFMFLF